VTRLYRLLLRAMPPAFRERFGDDMADLFADRCRDARRRGAAAVAWLFVRTILDVTRAGWLERRAARGRPSTDRSRVMRLEQFTRDVGYALRQLRRNPAFTGIAIATLALGIGVNTAMFSAVDAVLIRPLPYEDADRLVMIWDQLRSDGKFFTTPPEWVEWRRQSTAFTDIAATQPAQAALSSEGEPEELPARKVTANFWTVLGARPLFGRVFSEDEDVRGERVVVISHGLWQRRFGGSPDVLGRAIVLNDAPYVVVGVMPREFYFMPARDIDIWMPASFSAGALRHWGWHDLHCVARLKPGVTLRQAHDAMAALNLRVSAEHEVKPARSAVVTPLREELAGKTYTSLIVLLCGSAAVLLIACVNLANLLLSRGAVRRREVAVRAAIGAGRGRLIEQFLIESLLLAGLGAIAGLMLAIPVMRFLETLVPDTMAAVHLTLDGRVLLFSAALAIATGFTFGLVPALGGSRLALHEALRDGGRGSSGARSHRFQHALIIVETALAVVLLTSGGLLLQTFQHLRQLDLGIRSEKLLTFVTPLLHYPEFNRRVAFVNAELDKVRAIPGVIDAGAISRIPLTVNDQSTFYLLSGQSNDQARDQIALSRVVSREYFATVGARLREGRFFDGSDQRSDSPVAIVNDSFAARNFAGRSPVGARFQFGRFGEAYWYTIVGVVREIRDRGVAEELRPAVYRVHEQADQTGDQPSGIVVRTAVEPASIVAAVRQAIWSVDRNQPVARVQTMEAIVARQLSTPSQNTALLGAFALLALSLASLGLYGVLSYAVAQRTNEIGVRMALGATSGNILLFFSRRGLALTVVGLAIGIVLSFIASRLMTMLFYGFRPDYVPAVVAVSLVLLAVAALAVFIPARRASRIDPTIALQHE
jgi:putative ABC transport system permease protein